MNINIIKIIFYLLIIGCFFIFPNSIFAATNDVVINEIAWMGTEISYNDEWIELYNNTGQDIDLTGWILKAVDETPDIILEETIAANGYFLLERTNDDSVPNIIADQIYVGTLGNTGENLELYNSENNLIDSVNSSGEWFAGDNTTKQTMERKDSLESGSVSDNWQTSQEIHGTPKAQNSSGTETTPENSEDQPEEESTSSEITIIPVNYPPVAFAGTDITALINQEIIFDGSLSSDLNNDSLSYFWNFGDGATDIEQISKHTYLYPGQYIVSLLVDDGEFSDLDIITINIYNKSIIISEFLPDPEGTDAENEWIELFNQSDQIANLSNWQLDDQDGGSSPFVFPINSLIGPNQFLILIRPITNIALNNDNDQVRLIYPDGSLATEISYLAEKKEGFSIAFDNNDYFWTKIPTPGSANIISSTDLENKNKNLSSNNPEPVIQQSQDIPDVVVNTNLNQSQSFDASNPLAEPETCLLDSCTNDVIDNYDNPENFTASLSESTKSNQKSKLILYLSIIISGSLLLSWIIIQIRKTRKI
ncbi:MAG: lamin tail domain-containing protein [Patescibacteria group bacterium]|nr:lamin tail domain-containing protein [Patescibacteria group bacterium]